MAAEIRMDTLLEIFGGGGIIAGLVTASGLLWKIKSESRNAVEQAKIYAVETSAKATDTVVKIMDAQNKRIESQDELIVDLSNRMSAVDGLRNAAIHHIGERERWARSYWEERPPSLPTIPEYLLPEVLDVTPEIRHFFAELEEHEKNGQNSRLRKFLEVAQKFYDKSDDSDKKDKDS